MPTDASSLAAQRSDAEFDAYVVACAFFGAAAAFALADGSAAFIEAGAAPRRVKIHQGAILVAAFDSGRLVTGGDDGKVMTIDAQGRVAELADEKGKWIDAIAARADGAVAWSVNREVKARDAKGEIRSLSTPSTARGLAFFPKGYRLALACYNSVGLWFPNVSSGVDMLEWRGSHLGVTVSPDARFIVSSMQENALHGWRIADKKNMRMTGYPTKTRSFSWSAGGDWLATSGAEACIVWPFVTKDGPMGKPPSEYGVRQGRVTQVAFHPKRAAIAVGYDDGFILLCATADNGETVLRPPPAGSEKNAIAAIAWSDRGDRLAYGTVSGASGIIEVTA